MSYGFQTILAETLDERKLTSFWQNVFPEMPVCTEPGCGKVAREVDSFFPYLDDLNRCDSHRTVESATKRWETSGQSKRCSAQQMVDIRPHQWRLPMP